MKMSQLKMVIREVVREEIQLGLKEIIGEVNQTKKVVDTPAKNKQPKKKVVEKKHFSKNSVLNDVLNETAIGDEWKTLGGGKLDSSRMNDVVGQNYGDLMSGGNSTQPAINPNDPMAQFLNKDYREVLKKTEEKDDRKHGR